MWNINISGFADEISADITEQFEGLNEIGLKYFEPRNISGKSIASLNADEAKELKSKMDYYGIKASSIGSPVGKIDICDAEKHVELLKTVVETAKILECDKIRCFSFFNAHNERNAVMENLHKMAEYAEKNDVLLLHENEKDIYGDVISRVEDIFNTIKSDNFKAVFDAANFIQCGQNPNEAFLKVFDNIKYMHIKDAKEDGEVVPAGKGVTDYYAILKKLYDSNYNGFLSLEPHLGSFDGLASLELDDKMLHLEKSDKGKFKIAYMALNKIIDEVEK